MHDGNVKGANNRGVHMSVGTAVSGVVPKGEENEYFNPDDYVVGILRRAVANKQDVRIDLRSVAQIQVLTTRGEYFSSVGSLKTFFTAPAELFTVTCLSPEEASHLCASRGVGRNLDELMWQAAFYASAGRLMKGCFRDDVVQLRHWPNLTRLPAPPSAMRIAALLARYPTSVTLAGRLLKVPRNELYQFYSAARCAGVATAVNRKPAEPVLKPHRNQTLLSLLLHKIAGL